METIAFTKSKLPFGWCGNMSPFPVEYNGKTWRTTEALFQALRFEDETLIEEIRAEKSPMGAKLKAKRNVSKMIVKQLSEKDVENMKLCVKLKIEQHPEIKKQLIETGDAQIIEDVTRRGDKGSNLFWGAMLVGEEWIGKNVLGNVWMEARKELNEAK